jgi:hypothetical protein
MIDPRDRFPHGKARTRLRACTRRCAGCSGFDGERRLGKPVHRLLGLPAVLSVQACKGPSAVLTPGHVRPRDVLPRPTGCGGDTRTPTHTCTRARARAHTRSCTRTRTYAHTHARTRTHAHTHTHTHTQTQHTHMHTCAHTRTRTRAHAHAHTRTRTRSHTRARALAKPEAALRRLSRHWAVTLGSATSACSLSGLPQ